MSSGGSALTPRAQILDHELLRCVRQLLALSVISRQRSKRSLSGA